MMVSEATNTVQFDVWDLTITGVTCYSLTQGAAIAVTQYTTVSPNPAIGSVLVV